MTILQLCEQHIVKAIQRRLVYARKYLKERRKELISLVNAQIKALTKDDVIKAQDALLKTLKPKNCKYLINYYQLKEKQFLYYYIRTYQNGRVYST